MTAKGFYPYDPSDLLSQIGSSFLDKIYGPGYIPKEIKNNKRIISGIVPHANYNYFLPVSIKFYKELYENFNFETIIIVGPNHYNIGADISLLIDDWYTPFGIVKTDVEFVRKILNNFDAYEDPIAYKYEYSIELQLPIIRFLFKDKIKIVPIIIKKIEIKKIRELVKVIEEIAKDLNRRIVLISTGNLTHHGEFYGYIKYNENITENIKKEDKKYIDAILELNSKKLLKYLKDNKTVCGKYPFLFFIEFTRKYKGKIDLLNHISSSELNGDEKNIVDYFTLISYKDLI
jgi:AmmeMemoRadiSam system protein B